MRGSQEGIGEGGGPVYGGGELNGGVREDSKEGQRQARRDFLPSLEVLPSFPVL